MPDRLESRGGLARVGYDEEIERRGGGDPGERPVVDGECVVDDEPDGDDARTPRRGQEHRGARPRAEHERPPHPRLALDARLDDRAPRSVSVVADEHRHRDVGERREGRLVDDRAGDGEVVVRPPDLHVVDGSEAVNGDAARLARQVGEDGDAGPGPRLRLTERELQRRAETRRSVERYERVELLADLRPVRGPARNDVGPVRRGDQHRLVAGREPVEQRPGTAAGGVEPRRALFARLHARGHVEDQREPARGHAAGAALEVGTQVAADQREQKNELEDEERVGPEAAAVERACRDLLPEEERADGDHPPAAVVEIEDDERRDRRQTGRARRVQEAQVHRRPTTPRRARSPVTSS